MTLSAKLVAAALLAASAPLGAGTASAAPITAPQGLENAAAPAVETVQWRGGWRRGGWGGFVPGLAAGAIIGGLAAAPYAYGGYGTYGYPDYDYYGYAAAPEPYVAVVPDRDAGYCAQRFRSYDPASGTYLGYDGRRHPCP